MKGVKFTVYSATYIGSGYTDWESEHYWDYSIDIPNLRKLIRSYCKHKLVVTITQSDYSEKVLFEHELTYSYLDKLSMCKDAFSLLGIEVITDSKNKESDE